MKSVVISKIEWEKLKSSEYFQQTCGFLAYCIGIFVAMSCNRRHFLLSIQLLSLVSFVQDYRLYNKPIRIPLKEKTDELLTTCWFLDCFSRWNFGFLLYCPGIFYSIQFFCGNLLNGSQAVLCWFDSLWVKLFDSLCKLRIWLTCFVYCFISSSSPSVHKVPEDRCHISDIWKV